MGIVGITLSVLACQFLGMVWYGVLFGSVWAGSCGRTSFADLQRGGNPVIYLVPAVAKFITAFILDHILTEHLDARTVADVIPPSLVLSLLLALYEAVHAPFHGVGIPAYLVNVSYDAVCTLTTAVLLVTCC